MIHLSPATPGTLRERFVEDMTVRGFTGKTRKDYIRTVAGFAAFLERPPSTATAEDVLILHGFRGSPALCVDHAAIRTRRRSRSKLARP